MSSKITLSFHRICEIVAIGTFGIYSVLSLMRLWALAPDAATWGTMAAAVAAGYILADGLSGFVHWFADNYAHEDTPILGPSFVAPFRYHHVDPEDIAHHDFIETNGNNCIVSAPFLVVPYHWYAAEPGQLLDVFLLTIIWSSMVGIFLTNQFHKWAHMKHAPAWVKLLQKSKLILSPDHHQLHHTLPHDSHYCITTGWLNRPLHTLKFFRGLEWIMAKLLSMNITSDARAAARTRTDVERGACP